MLDYLQVKLETDFGYDDDFVIQNLKSLQTSYERRKWIFHRQHQRLSFRKKLLAFVLRR